MKKSYLRILMLLSSTCGTPFAAHAQGVTPDSGTSSEASGVAEIVVTAQKRAERINDVPVSITAATSEQLARQGITDPTQLGRIVPGFTYQPSSFGTPVFTMRGVGLYSDSVGVAPTVSVYVDQVPLPYLVMTSGASFDLERLEALKGPQGILFGQNSTGGAINYIAAKPTKTAKLGFNLSYGRFNQVDSDAFVSGPITDTLSARVAIRHEYQDGYQISQSRPQDRLGARDFTTGRILLAWEPVTTLHLEFNANGWRDRSETPALQYKGFVAARPGGYPESEAAIAPLPLAPNDPRLADWDGGRDYRRDDSFYQFSLKGDLDLGGSWSLASITAYSHLNSDIPGDADGTAFSNINTETVSKVRSFYQELRVSGNIGDAVKLTLGGNYQHDAVDEDQRPDFISSNSGIGPFRYRFFTNRANQKVSTYAGFVSADVKITPTVTIQSGLRYTKQDRAFNGCLLDAGDGDLARGIAAIPALAGLGYNPAPAGSCVTLADATLATLPDVRSNLNQNNLSWRGGVNWKPATDALIYANVTKGYKAGAYSPLPAVFASQLTPVTQESVLAYEAGFKANLLRRTVQLTGAAFYYDYRDKQIQGYRFFAGLGLNLPALQNIPKTSIRGAEVSVLLRPIRGLEFSGGATYVDSRVDGDILAPDPFGNVVNLKSESFPSTPKWQAIGNADYSFPVNDGLSAFIGGGATFRSKTNAAFGNSPVTVIGAYTLFDVRAGIETADGRLRLQIWGQNITNRYYVQNIVHVVDAIAASAGRPATYGVTLSGRF